MCLRQSKLPRTPLTSLPMASTSAELGWRLKRDRYLAEEVGEVVEEDETVPQYGHGDVLQVVELDGHLLGSLHTTRRLTDDQEMLWAEPHVTWSIVDTIRNTQLLRKEYNNSKSNNNNNNKVTQQQQK